MARRDNRNRILAIRRTHRPDRTRVADLLGDLAVAAGFAERNGQQRCPDLFLELRADKLQIQLEMMAAAGEVFAQLLRRAQQNRIVRRFAHRAEPHPAGFVVFPEDGRQSRAVRNQLQLADRRRQGAAGVGHAEGRAEWLNGR